MKKTMRLLALVAMGAGLLMAGCEKEENGGNNNGGGNNGGGDSNTTVEWIDLGLPSGLLWASCNVGATAPEDYGDYFAWGETQPKNIYSWSTYRYCTVDGGGNVSTLTKYNTNTVLGTVDNLTTLQSGDDAATANLGGGARTPTFDEWIELNSNTISVQTTLNGVSGITFTASNGKSIFLPNAGQRYGSELEYAGSRHCYWSSSLSESNPRYAFFFFSMSMSNDDRSIGFSVRAVRRK